MNRLVLQAFVWKNSRGAEITLAYLHSDCLGSIVAVSNQEGDIIFEQNFDAWGRRRHAETFEPMEEWEIPGWLWRGYTGHEHLDEFGLINMNGRMYDPVLGRMLSPDNYVQDPYFTQSYNRYSYVWNNPLKYTDPSGEFVIAAVIIGTIVGAYFGGSVANNSYNPLQWDYNSASTYAGMGIGAVVGGFGGYYVGAAIKAGSAAKIVSSAYAGGLNVLYNYSEDQSVATQLGYFAAGFAATSLGSWAVGSGGATLGQAKLAAMASGGLSTMAVAGFSGEITDGYTAAQSFMGGALVGYAGTSYYAKTAGIKSKYVFGKGTDKMLARGFSNVATNFAFTDKDEYLKMGAHGRYGAPFMYGVIGHIAEGLMPFDAIEGKLESRLLKFGLGVGAYGFGFGAEYVGMTFSKGYYESGFKDAKYGRWKKKTAIVGWKSLFYGLTLY